MKPIEIHVPHHIDTESIADKELLVLMADDDTNQGITFDVQNTHPFDVSKKFIKISALHFCSMCAVTNGRNSIRRRFTMYTAEKREEDSARIFIDIGFLYDQPYCRKVSVDIVTNAVYLEFLES